MDLSLYISIQEVLMGIILAIGGHLVFEQLPEQVRGGRLHMAGRIMGFGVAIVPIASFIYFFTDMQYAEPEYATAINLSAYCITTTLIATAYYVLLDKISDKPLVRTQLIVGLLYPIPLWLGLCFGSETVARHILVASYTLFCVLATIHIFNCIYLYRLRVKTEKNLSVVQVIELKLVGRTIYVSAGLMVISMLSPSFYKYPLWLGMIFIASFIAGVAYVYAVYHRTISRNFKRLTIAPHEVLEYDNFSDIDIEEEPESSTTAINDQTKESIEKHLQCWLDNKEFLNPTISISNVSKAAFTNRTYLSKYVNSVYKCSFKAWVTQLRIEEAKKLMTESEELSISQIAIQTGFASMVSFSHTFTRIEGVAPSKWRETHNTTKGE